MRRNIPTRSKASLAAFSTPSNQSGHTFSSLLSATPVTHFNDADDLAPIPSTSSGFRGSVANRTPAGFGSGGFATPLPRATPQHHQQQQQQQQQRSISNIPVPNEVLSALLVTVVQQVSVLAGESSAWLPPLREGQRVDTYRRFSGANEWDSWATSLRTCPQFDDAFWASMRQEMERCAKISNSGLIDLNPSDLDSFRKAWSSASPSSYSACAVASQRFRPGTPLHPFVTADRGGASGIGGENGSGVSTPFNVRLQREGGGRGAGGQAGDADDDHNAIDASFHISGSSTIPSSPDSAIPTSSMSARRTQQYGRSSAISSSGFKAPVMSPERDEEGGDAPSTSTSISSSSTLSNAANTGVSAFTATPFKSTPFKTTTTTTTTSNSNNNSSARAHVANAEDEEEEKEEEEEVIPTATSYRSASRPRPTIPDTTSAAAGAGASSSTSSGPSSTNIFRTPADTSTSSSSSSTATAYGTGLGSSKSGTAQEDRMLNPSMALILSGEVVVPDAITAVPTASATTSTNGAGGGGGGGGGGLILNKWSVDTMEDPRTVTVFGLDTQQPQSQQRSAVLDTLRVHGVIVRQWNGPHGRLFVTFDTPAAVVSALRNTGACIRVNADTIVGVAPYACAHERIAVTASGAAGSGTAGVGLDVGTHGGHSYGGNGDYMTSNAGSGIGNGSSSSSSSSSGGVSSGSSSSMIDSNTLDAQSAYRRPLTRTVISSGQYGGYTESAAAVDGIVRVKHATKAVDARIFAEDSDPRRMGVCKKVMKYVFNC